MQPLHHPGFHGEQVRIHVMVDVVLERIAPCRLSRFGLGTGRNERRHVHHWVRISPFVADDDRLGCPSRDSALRKLVLWHIEVELVVWRDFLNRGRHIPGVNLASSCQA